MSEQHAHIITNQRIKKLSPLLIHQLAAGEVVTRPAAVVKELLENAIDAGATHIDVRITQGGMGLIEVMDNGIGIHPDDMVMAMLRHATSKVADVANLQGIRTLGFRGEALAAIAAVSRLTLTSSHDDEGIGRQLHVAGIVADSPKVTPIVHHHGTTVTVKDLYFNVPARRGHLKSIATEFNHIETIVREVALARADVTLNLYHNHKKRLALSVHLTPISLAVPHVTENSQNVQSLQNLQNSHLSLSRLEQALGIGLRDSALAIMIDLATVMPPSLSTQSPQSANISGWLWPIIGSQTPHTTLPKLLYVNGRLVKEIMISTPLRQLANSANLTGMGYALYFELPNEWLNINVHPTKQRIKISSLNNIMAHLSHTIGLKLKTLAVSTPNVDQVNISAHKNAHNDRVYAQATLPLSEKPSILQQVQTPKQHYKSGQQLTDRTMLPANNAIILPQCLEVITSGADRHFVAPSLKLDAHALPWLLFCHHGQYTLISAEKWQKNISVCAAKISYHQEISVMHPSQINQQLQKSLQETSPQLLKTVVIEIEEVLLKNAITTIDNTQLVTLMLSSANH